MRGIATPARRVRHKEKRKRESLLLLSVIKIGYVLFLVKYIFANGSFCMISSQYI